MKTRNGFVSNSSSSSFIILGVRMEDEELAKQLGWNETLDITEGEYIEEKLDELGIEALYDDSYTLFGYIIADSDANDFPETVNSMAELSVKSNLLAEKLSMKPEEIKLLTGVRSC